MQWIEVSVPTRSDEIDDVCAQLAELGAGGMVVEDETDFQQFLEQNHQYWDYVDDALEAQFRGVSRIKFYLADDDDGRAQLAAIRAGIGRELTTATVRDSDWENNWRQYYQPIEVGERLVVVPEWLDAPADGPMPLFKKDGKLAAQFDEQILLAVRVLHHKSDILVFHIVKIIFCAGVHGHLLAAQQHQQLPLLFGGVKIALRAVPIGDHRCSSICKVCGRFFPPNDPFNPFP